MAEDDVFLLDTNLLVYAYDISEVKKHPVAKKLLERGFKGEIKLALSVQNLNEFSSVATSKIEFPLPIDSVIEIVEGISDSKVFSILTFNEDTVLKALGICKRHGASHWDALIAATMIENGILRIYTENTKDFSMIEGIKAVNPFG